MSVIENHPQPTTAGLAIESLRVRNFKAIQDSGDVKFTPLTVLIGNNGAGKSSLIEALEMLQRLSADGLDEAIQPWRGFEHALNKFAPAETTTNAPDAKRQSASMTFEIGGSSRRVSGEGLQGSKYRAVSEMAMQLDTNEVVILNETLEQTSVGGLSRTVKRDPDGKIVDVTGKHKPFIDVLRPAISVLYAEPSMVQWQFIRLNSEVIGPPRLPRSSGGYLSLSPDGKNTSEYFDDLQRRDARITDGIIETLQVVLPYITDLEPVVTSKIGRSVHLQFHEHGKYLQGWMMSTGTLRLVALLALFRNPTPPPLIVIEELENGLDPRTISLIVEEIRELVRSGRSQVIITTHSPYLLDLLPLESMIFVERVDGQPTFTRPSDDEDVVRWREDFAPGRLYTMGRFRTGR